GEVAAPRCPCVVPRQVSIGHGRAARGDVENTRCSRIPMVWDGVVNASGEPFKQRVARSIRARLTRESEHLPFIPFLTRQVCTGSVSVFASSRLPFGHRDDLPLPGPERLG